MPTIDDNSLQEENKHEDKREESFIKTADPNRRYKYVGKNNFINVTDEDILKDISLRIQDGRRLIIPIGLPNSGKSMFIASLIAYAFRRDAKEDNSCNFTHVVPKEDSGVKDITDALDRRTVLPTTTSNEFTIIDLNMKSRYRDKTIKVSLLDFAGEDIKRITGSNPHDLDGTAQKILNILAACIAQRAIFAILTPVDIHLQEVGQKSDFDDNEDNEMKSFIDKIKVYNPKLYRQTKILMIVTKWDLVPDKVNSATFLRMQRNQLFNEYSSNSKSYGLLPYSVGNVQGKTIINISLRSPKNFWYTLYRWCTGKHVLPWWIRIFS